MSSGNHGRSIKEFGNEKMYRVDDLNAYIVGCRNGLVE
jgi:hypothetical protein